MEQYQNELAQLSQILGEVIDTSKPIEPQIRNVLKTLMQDPNVMKSPIGKFLQQVDPNQLIGMLSEMVQNGNAAPQEGAPQEGGEEGIDQGMEDPQGMGGGQYQEPNPADNQNFVPPAEEGYEEEEEEEGAPMQPPMAKKGYRHGGNVYKKY